MLDTHPIISIIMLIVSNHREKKEHLICHKGPYSQNYGFSSSYIWMWELDQKKGWALKNWCFQTGVGEDSWESLGLQGDPTSPS